MAWGRLTRIGRAAVLGAAAIAAAPAAGVAGRPPLFGAGELASTDIALFPQWTSTLDRLAVDPAAWAGAFDRLRGTDAVAQIRGVNDAVNRVAYVEDGRNWGQPDRWSAPAEFFARGGDCEDFAIAKYAALRRLGFAAETLRIVVVQDERRDLAHAVLAVYQGDDILILDNLSDQPVPAAGIGHYRPFYSINETGWWLH